MPYENLLPPHGRMKCEACFSNGAEWGTTSISAADGWTLDNNPCAWGARNPRFLILGFSKGERQSRGILGKRHDGIPYAGFRPRLTKGLQTLGLLAEGDTIDAHIRPNEPDWAFGSVVRCTLAENGKKSGTIISSAATASGYLEWRDRCTDLYLSNLPPRLQIVVMLSNDDQYIESCRTRITDLHPGTQRINDVAYGNGQVTWVHIVHFGGQGFNHMNDWTNLADNTAGRKGKCAVSAVRKSLAGT
ncbi:hypothetical protein [Mesorhizobium sp. M0579]|uniref:hypothetical protein n=1 Tax=Mesorhizobium sp. M0579 TaxID=2956962 RepID=UPI0033381528